MGIKLGLHNMEEGLCALGISKNIGRVVHVAGTNGKGSTCKILHKLLMDSNPSEKIGLYTSPHLIDYKERIRINNDNISQEDFLELGFLIFDKCKNIPLTFFEFTTLLCFLHFQRNKTDIAIIETGLGGRLDATNILEPELCLISSISFDHAEYLGNTLEQIAMEKAGIFKKGSIAILQKNDYLDILRREAQKVNVAKIIEDEKDYSYFINKDTTFNFTYKRKDMSKIEYNSLKINLLGKHQYKNASQALVAMSELGANMNEDTIRRSLSSVDWPGRLERLEIDQKTIYLDVSHNPEGIATTIDYIHNVHTNKKIYTACGFVRDKEYKKMISMLSTISQKVLLIPTSAGERSTSPKDYLDITDTHCNKIYICKDYKEAVSIVLNETTSGSIILFTGSLFNYEHISKILRPLI